MMSEPMENERRQMSQITSYDLETPFVFFVTWGGGVRLLEG